jgi:hypothetical protein
VIPSYEGGIGRRICLKIARAKTQDPIGKITKAKAYIGRPRLKKQTE